MDATSTTSLTQLLLGGTLLILLLTWMVTFLVLALRSEATQHTYNEDISSAAPTLSATSTMSTAQSVPLVTTPNRRPVVTLPPAERHLLTQ